MGDLGSECRQIPLFVDRRAANVTVEVTIGALRQAERPMHVDPEPRVDVGSRARNLVANHAVVMPANSPSRQRAGLQKRYSASSPVSPVRTRMARSSGRTKIFPSPI